MNLFLKEENVKNLVIVEYEKAVKAFVRAQDAANSIYGIIPSDFKYKSEMKVFANEKCDEIIERTNKIRNFINNSMQKIISEDNELSREANRLETANLESNSISTLKNDYYDSGTKTNINEIYASSSPIENEKTIKNESEKKVGIFSSLAKLFTNIFESKKSVDVNKMDLNNKLFEKMEIENLTKNNNYEEVILEYNIDLYIEPKNSLDSTIVDLKSKGYLGDIKYYEKELPK